MTIFHKILFAAYAGGTLGIVACALYSWYRDREQRTKYVDLQALRHALREPKD